MRNPDPPLASFVRARATLQWLRRRASLLLLLTACSFLTGCGTVDLYSRLTETETNEMIAILRRRGIEAEKAASEENTWTIKVATDRFSEAVEILKAQGYPREKFTNMATVFKKSGLVSSPAEERIRFMSALSEEIAETLTHIDGVLTARVHINLPNSDPFSEKAQQSSAAVFIRYRADRNLQNSALQIKTLVVNSIEGLSLDKVSLALFPAEMPGEGSGGENAGELGGAAAGGGWQDVYSLRVARGSAERLRWVLGALIALLALTALLAGYFFLRARRRPTAARDAGSATSPTAGTLTATAARPPMAALPNAN